MYPLLHASTRSPNLLPEISHTPPLDARNISCSLLTSYRLTLVNVAPTLLHHLPMHLDAQRRTDPLYHSSYPVECSGDLALSVEDLIVTLALSTLAHSITKSTNFWNKTFSRPVSNLFDHLSIKCGSLSLKIS
jgi:hypothetical protein